MNSEHKNNQSVRASKKLHKKGVDLISNYLGASSEDNQNAQQLLVNFLEKKVGMKPEEANKAVTQW